MKKFLASLATSLLFSLLFSIKNKNQSAAASFIITRSYGQRSAATQRLRLFELYDQNAGRSQRLQQFSTGSRVWFQLVIGEEALSYTSLSLNEDDFIDDLKVAVKKDYESRLAHVAKGDLTIYPPGTTIPVPSDLKACPVGSKVNEHSTTAEKGYIVVAPSQQMNADGE